MLVVLLVGLLALASYSSAGPAPLEGRVVWNSVCSGYSELGHTKVVLDDGLYSGSIKRDGTFTIPDVDEGSYTLSVLSHDHIFDNLRVDVFSSGDAFPDVHPYIIGTPHDPPSPVSLQYPIVLTPRQKTKFFIEKQSFNALSMLNNPMILLTGVMGVFVLGLPYLMKNMDPEMAKELNEQQARVSGIQSAMQTGDFRGGLSALLAEANATPEGASTHVQSSPKAGSKPRSGKGGKKK